MCAWNNGRISTFRVSCQRRRDYKAALEKFVKILSIGEDVWI
jgi:hypothetical protein